MLVVVVAVLPIKVIPSSQGVSVKRKEKNADSKKTISKKEKTRNADGK